MVHLLLSNGGEGRIGTRSFIYKCLIKDALVNEVVLRHLHQHLLCLLLRELSCALDGKLRPVLLNVVVDNGLLLGRQLDIFILGLLQSTSPLLPTSRTRLPRPLLLLGRLLLGRYLCSMRHQSLLLLPVLPHLEPLLQLPLLQQFLFLFKSEHLQGGELIEVTGRQAVLAQAGEQVLVAVQNATLFQGLETLLLNPLLLRPLNVHLERLLPLPLQLLLQKLVLLLF